MSARLLSTLLLLTPRIASPLLSLRHTVTSSRMSTAAKTPAVPRLSASLLLLNPRNEILLIHRPTHSSTFPNAHVFPGGATSPDDFAPSPTHDPLKLCAIRETFEETGLLLTTPPPPPPVVAAIPTARAQIHAGTLSFSAYLRANGLAPAVDALVPFTTWITPQSLPRRFETHMFLCLLPEDHASSSCCPSGDGGIEVLSTRFLAPQAALAAARRDELVFFPPQFYLLSRVAACLGGGGGGGEAVGVEDHVAGVRRRRLLRFAQGGFGEMVMEPAALRRLADGRVVMGLGERGDREWAVVVELAGGRGEPRGLEMVRREEAARL